jgi:hypothetical protein
MAKKSKKGLVAPMKLNGSMEMTVNGPGSGKFSASTGVVRHPLADKKLSPY